MINIPIFSSKNVCISYEYQIDNKKTTVGWLKYLFLWQEDAEYSAAISDKQRLQYYKIEKLFKKINNIGQSTDLDFWEDKTPLDKQIKYLNNFRLAYIQYKKQSNIKIC